MRIIGNTNQINVLVVSEDRKFIMNEFLIISDKINGDVIGEVMETYEIDGEDLNPLSIFGIDRTLDGFKNIAKVKLLNELPSPVDINSYVRLAEFNEVRSVIQKNTRKEDGMVIGVIRGTENIKDVPNEWKNIVRLFEKDKGILQQEGVPFIFNHKKLDELPHIGLFGGSGSGKSFGLRVLAEEIQEKRIPNIIIDPHNELDFSKSFEGIDDEYKKDYLNTFEIFTIGKNASVKFEDITTDELASALSSSSQLTDVMQSALRRLHKEGETLDSFKNKLDELIIAFEEEENLKNKKNYNSDTIKSKIYQEMKNDIAGLATLKAISWRFSSLLSLGLFKDKNNYGITKIEKCLMDRKTAVIRGNVYMLSIFSGYIVKHFYKKRRIYKENLHKGYVDKFPPFFLMIDEAHNFCPKGKFEMPVKSVIKEIAQEGRKYGVFLILASQRPALIEDTTVAQINTKFIFRTVRASDKEMIAEETDLNTSELNRLPYLNSGDAFISSGIIGRTIFIRFRTSKTESPHSDNPFDELDKIFNDKIIEENIVNEDIINYMKNGNIINTLRLHDVYIEIFKDNINKIKFEDFEKTLESLYNDGLIKKEELLFGDVYKIR